MMEPMVARTDFSRHKSPLARAAHLVCDAWTPLIVGELFLGPARFDKLAEALGMSRNILARRLKHLEEGGVVRRCAAAARGRHAWALTEQGEALFGPLVALMQWGERWLEEPQEPAVDREGPQALIDPRSGREVTASVVDRRTGDPIELDRFDLARG